MKSIILIEESGMQIVLSPENDFEKSAIQQIYRESTEKQPDLFLGGYYKCQGGWQRENTESNSLIIRFDKETENKGVPA